MSSGGRVEKMQKNIVWGTFSRIVVMLYSFVSRTFFIGIFGITNQGINCDEKGMQGNVEIWSLQGKRVFLCPESAEGLNFNMAKASAAHASIKENYVLGIIGALIGSLVVLFFTFELFVAFD